MKKILYAFALIVTLSIIGGLSYAYFVAIPKEVEKRILANFTNLGFETFWFEGIEHDNGKVIISNITLDKDGFSTIERVDIKVSLWRFFLSPDSAQDITIKGLNLTGSLSENLDVTLSGIPDYNKFMQHLPMSAARIINIEQSTANLLSETFGGIRVDYSGQVNFRDLSNIAINGTLSSRQHKLSFHSKIKGNIDDQKNLNITAETEQISVLKKDLSLKRGSGVISVLYNFASNSARTNADFHIANLNWKALPLNKLKGSYSSKEQEQNLFIEGQTSGLNIINWSADIKRAGQRITSADIALTPNNIMDAIDYLKHNDIIAKDEEFPSNFKMIDRPIIKINAQQNEHHTFDGTFQGFLTSPNVIVNGIFTQDQSNMTTGSFYVSKTNIFPSGEKTEPKETSYLEISSSGAFEYKAKAPNKNLNWSLKTQVHNGQIDFGAFKIPKISGSFKHNQSSKNSRLSLPFKLSLKDGIEQKGSISLNTNDKTAPILGIARLSIYGGDVQTKTSIIKQSGDIQDEFSLSVSDINISQLFKDAGFDDVTVYGYMGGLIPMKISEKDVDVNGGILQSQGGGVVNMSEKMARALFPGDSNKMQTIRAALNNYHYEFFEIRLDGDLSGRIMMTLNASGTNPDFKSAKPIDLNLQIETQISMLFSSLLKK